MKTFRVIATVLLIAWMVMIFCFSAQTATESSNTSGKFITEVVRFFYSDFEEMSKVDQAELVESFQFVVRKGAHISVYAVLGGLAFAAVMTYKKLSIELRLFLNVVICIGYSVSDEIHQHYVPGRSCEIRDVIFDSSGALTAILLLLLITRCKRFYKHIYGGVSMSKKDLKDLYEQSCEKINALNLELENTRIENEALSAQIKSFEIRVKAIAAEKFAQKLQPVAEIPKENLKPECEITPERELGAKVIGRIIVNAAKYCNKLTSVKEGQNVKELINLVLGRTEVAKAEILNIVTSKNSLEEMKAKVSKEEADAEDYFESVLGQI